MCGGHVQTLPFAFQRKYTAHHFCAGVRRHGQGWKGIPSDTYQELGFQKQPHTPLNFYHSNVTCNFLF